MGKKPKPIKASQSGSTVQLKYLEFLRMKILCYKHILHGVTLPSTGLEARLIICPLATTSSENGDPELLLSPIFEELSNNLSSCSGTSGMGDTGR